MKKEVITTYAQSTDYTKLWIIFQSENTSMMKAILQKMPLHKYMELLIHELAFHEIPSFSNLQLSLN